MFVLDFSNVEASQNPDHTQYREILVHDKRFRIVEYEKNASHPDWCSKGHHGFVLEGEIMYELENGSARVRAGNAFLISPGTRHRGHNVFPGVTRFFLVDD
jgi:quercetin dioxygenase-like cupin family protein